MDKLKSTKQYLQICAIYPSDLAIIIATYLLEKQEKHIKSWDCDVPLGKMSVIGGNVVVIGLTQKTYKIDGTQIDNQFDIPLCSYCAEDEENIYVADYFKHCLTIHCKQTGVKRSLQKHFISNPHGIAVLSRESELFAGKRSSIVYIADPTGNCIYEYDVERNEFSKQSLEYYPFDMKTHDGSLYIKYICVAANSLDHKKVYGITCRNKNEKIESVTSKEINMYDFAVYENKIFVCMRDGVDIYSIEGDFIRQIAIQKPAYINMLGDNMIIKTFDGKIVVYSMEYWENKP